LKVLTYLGRLKTRDLNKIVETDIPRLDNVAPYSKSGHREICFNVRVSAH